MLLFFCCLCFFFFKQKTAYEMRISDWSSDVCSSDLRGAIHHWSFCTPARAQANAFVTTVPRSADALPAVLDIAFTDECATRPDRAAAIAALETFLRIAETHTGEPMLLKISKAVAKASHPARSFARPIWSARKIGRATV